MGKRTVLVFLSLICAHSVDAIDSMYDAINKGQFDKVQSVLEKKYHFNPKAKSFRIGDFITRNPEDIISAFEDFRASKAAIARAIDDKENGVANGVSYIAGGLLIPVITYFAISLPVAFAFEGSTTAAEVERAGKVILGFVGTAGIGGLFSIKAGVGLIKNAGPADHLKVAQKEIAEKSKIFLRQFNNYCDEHRIKLPREVQKELWEFEDFLKKD